MGTSTRRSAEQADTGTDVVHAIRLSGRGALDEDDEGTASVDDGARSANVDVGVGTASPDGQDAADVAKQRFPPAASKGRWPGADEPRPWLAGQSADRHQRVDPGTVERGGDEVAAARRQVLAALDGHVDGRKTCQGQVGDVEQQPGEEAEMAVGITSQPVEAFERSRPASRGERFRAHGRAACRQVVVGIPRGGHRVRSSREDDA